MEQVTRTLAILAAGAALVASHVLSYQGTPHDRFGVVDALHFAFPLIIYVFANLLIDEGRARERADQGKRR